MNFVVIGITDHPQPFLTPDVMKVIQTSHHFSGGRRHHERVAHLLPSGAQWVDITIPLDNVFATYREIEAKTPDTQIVVFASGDPLFFGFANTLRQRMPHATITLHAAFNSLQMLAHRLLMPYHDMRIVSLTGRPWQEFDRASTWDTPHKSAFTPSPLMKQQQEIASRPTASFSLETTSGEWGFPMQNLNCCTVASE